VSKRTPTTKDVALLHQLFDQDQIELAPEFQRNSIWTRSAKAYLIDTILNDRPIPLLYFQRMTSAQTGKPKYAVIDGQQRLRAILEFLNDRFRLVESKNKQYRGKKFSELAQRFKDQILDYDLYVQELFGYTEADIRDTFVRMNKYVVKLAPQEIRHAEHKGKFSNFVERIGTWDVWKKQRIFTPKQIKRMRAVEFVAELSILLLEGPQDKKRQLISTTSGLNAASNTIKKLKNGSSSTLTGSSGLFRVLARADLESRSIYTVSLARLSS
jgi:Protein of unknown function DUF262